MKMSQSEEILHHLKLGHKLTALEALDRFKCFRLASRINDLKRQGHIIQAKAVKTATGKTISEYSMADHQTNLFEAQKGCMDYISQQHMTLIIKTALKEGRTLEWLQNETKNLWKAQVWRNVELAGIHRHEQKETQKSG